MDAELVEESASSPRTWPRPAGCRRHPLGRYRLATVSSPAPGSVKSASTIPAEAVELGAAESGPHCDGLGAAQHPTPACPFTDDSVIVRCQPSPVPEPARHRPALCEARISCRRITSRPCDNQRSIPRCVRLRCLTAAPDAVDMTVVMTMDTALSLRADAGSPTRTARRITAGSLRRIGGLQDGSGGFSRHESRNGDRRRHHFGEPR